jgi:hypothetical protein
MADFEAGLFSISISDGDDSAPEAAEPSKSTAKVPGTARIAQSEDEFQAVKQGYRVKVENGEVSWSHANLSLLLCCNLLCVWHGGVGVVVVNANLVCIMNLPNDSLTGIVAVYVAIERHHTTPG